MKKISIEFDEKGLVITDETLKYQTKGNISTGVIRRESSQVPSVREGDEWFNRLREIARKEWVFKVSTIINEVMLNKIKEEMGDL